MDGSSVHFLDVEFDWIVQNRHHFEVWQETDTKSLELFIENAILTTDIIELFLKTSFSIVSSHKKSKIKNQKSVY